LKISTADSRARLVSL